jgi:hypothetical protein
VTQHHPSGAHHGFGTPGRIIFWRSHISRGKKSSSAVEKESISKEEPTTHTLELKLLFTKLLSHEAEE